MGEHVLYEEEEVVPDYRPEAKWDVGGLWTG
jgi:hypothetical protein